MIYKTEWLHAISVTSQSILSGKYLRHTKATSSLCQVSHEIKAN